MELLELEAYLNDYLEAGAIEDVCPNGLQVEGKPQIKRVATAVSANLATVRKAGDLEVDALIVHHGLFWNRDAYPITGSKKDKLELLLERKISLFGYHLPLDAHKEVGNNWRAARALGWEGLKPFLNYNGTFIGVMGHFAPHSIEEFIQKVQIYYDHPAIAALGGSSSIASAALVSGGAHKEISKAAGAGVDCFITGSFDEPTWSAAHEEKIHFLALGHSATERVGPKALAEHLQQELGLDAFFIDIPNPF